MSIFPWTRRSRKLAKNHVPSPAQALEITLRSDVRQIIADIGNVALRSTISDEVLREVPILNFVVAAGRMIRTVQDILLVKKLIFFLTEIESTTLDERIAFLSKAAENKKVSEDFGSLILTVLVRIEETTKAKLIGLVFRKMVLGTLSQDIGTRIILIIEKAFWADLVEMGTIHESKILESIDLVNAINPLGILMDLDMGVLLGGSGKGYPGSYEINPIGKVLIEVLKQYFSRKEEGST